MNDIDTSWLNWELIMANKEWLFSGVGLIIFTILGYFFFIRPKNRQMSQQLEQIIDNTKNQGDTTSPKTSINDSTINGPIHTGQGDINYQGIPPEQYKQLSKELGVTESALGNFFDIIKKKQVPISDLDNTLREIAKHYKELMAKVATLNSDDPEVTKLIEQAKQALEDGEFDKAEQFFNQASELDIKAAEQAQEIANKRFISAAASLAANGNLKLTQLAYRESGEYYERAAKLLPVGNDEVLALYLNWAGYAFYDAALYDKVKSLFERSLAIREKVFGDEHPDVALSLNNLAGLHQTQGNYDQAKPLYERSLAIREKVFGKEHPDVALSFNNLAELHQSQGNYDQAKPLYERAFAIWEKIHGKEHPSVAISLNNLALLHKTQGHYDQAKPLYERSLAIFEKVYSKDHPSVATSLNNLAELHRVQGHYDEAKPLYERSLAIREKVFGDEHPDVATSLNNLALLHYSQGNYDQAKPLYERSLAIWEKVHGKDHPSVATSLNNLALLHNSQGHYDQAKPLYERSLAIWEKVHGKEHPDIATDLNNLAGLYENQGKYDKAKPLYERSLKILNKFFEPDHPYVRMGTENYNDLLSKMAEQ
jgi:tetratricopeptide (TPR) repeat protein